MLKSRLLFAVAVSLFIASSVGCSTSNSSSTPTPAPPAPVPDSPQVIDLRFQQVGAPTTASGYIGYVFSNVLNDLGQSFGNMIGSPLETGDVCNAPSGSPFDCYWEFSTFYLPASVSGISTDYRSGNTFSGLEADLAALTRPDTVITSIDLRPASNTYAISSMRTTQTSGFILNHEVVAPGNLAAFVATEGTAGRVVTALSPNGTNFDVFSYAWQGNTTDIYDTSVQMATVESVPTVAENLAASGYIITAFKGDSTKGFALIGTKLHGSSASRPLLIVPMGSQKSQLWDQGYATIGLYFNAKDGSTIFIGEK